jgi:uncharacterized membrane protein YphA (DoxX/SURF4 family)
MMGIDRQSILDRVDQFLFRSVPIFPLVTFRVFFGLLIAFSTYRFVAEGWVDSHYVDPAFHFKYPGFAWVESFNGLTMYSLHYLLIVAGICMALGLFYRVASLLIFLVFTYTELIDLTYYLNHYYFVSTISFLMICLPANRFFSLDLLLKRTSYSKRTRHWHIAIIKFMIAIVYVYAGLAKINADWLLSAMPLKLWLPAHDDLFLIGPLLQKEWVAYAFSWFGMLFDSCIIFVLLNRKLRPFAYVLVVVFHLLTALLFQIGVFPYVMICSVLIFFSDRWHYRIYVFVSGLFPFKRASNFLAQKPLMAGNLVNSSLTRYLLLAFVCFQLLFPWRYLLYSSDLFWKEEGYRFSWRVMLMEKSGSATFYLKKKSDGRKLRIDNREFLTHHQEKQMATQPDLIYQYVLLLEKHFRDTGIEDPVICSEIWVTLNGRPSALYFPVDFDLSAVDSYAEFLDSMLEKPVKE